jgi:signal transduction histidine kinase
MSERAMRENIQPVSEEFTFSKTWLRFCNPQTEQSFTRHALQNYMGFIRIYLVGGTALYALFGLLDERAGGSTIHLLFFIRYAVVCPLLLAVFALSFTSAFEQIGPTALASTMLTSGLGIVAMTAVMPPPFNSAYYAGLIMVVIYCGSFIRISFAVTFAISLFLVLAYECSAILINPIPPSYLIGNNFFLLMSTAVGLLSSYMQETQIRRGYIAQRIIEAKNETATELLLEANKANRSKSEFLANMSHELRTPLNAVIGFADLMDMEAFGPVGAPQYVDYVRDIRSSGQHLLSIINDILDLAKAEANKLTMEERNVDIIDLAWEAVRICAPKGEERQISIAVGSFAPRVIVCVDHRLMLQLVLNLLSNAVKFSRAGGIIKISVERTREDGMAISVRDHGIGIAKENIPRILRPFEQIETSYARQHGGTGLGLPLVVKLAELHGGVLSITSELNEGTTATVTLPSQRLISVTESCEEHEALVAV